MKKILRKGAILLVIFVAVVACTSLLMNSQSTDNRSDMNDATLPEVMVKLVWIQAADADRFHARQYYTSGYDEKADI